MIVVDTNVIAAFQFANDRTPDAYAVMRRDPDWAAPRLWRSEFRNVLVTEMRHARLSPAGAARLMSAAEAAMEGNEHDVPSVPVLELAHASGCTAYDCEFVALALALGVPLVTLDQKVCRAFPEVALTPEAFIHE